MNWNKGTNSAELFDYAAVARIRIAVPAWRLRDAGTAVPGGAQKAVSRAEMQGLLGECLKASARNGYTKAELADILLSQRVRSALYSTVAR